MSILPDARHDGKPCLWEVAPPEQLEAARRAAARLSQEHRRRRGGGEKAPAPEPPQAAPPEPQTEAGGRPPQGAPAAAPGPQDPRPEILLGPEEHACVALAVEALAGSDRDLYQRGGQL